MMCMIQNCEVLHMTFLENKMHKMKISSCISVGMILLFMIFHSPLSAQDDLYFNPDTDEDFSHLDEKYADSEVRDEYVNDAFDEGDYSEDDEFYYSRRIRRFNRSFGSSFGYYDPCYANNSFYSNNPFYDPFYNSGSSVWVNFGTSYVFSPFSVSPWGNYYGYNPYSNPWGNPIYGYNPYYTPYGYGGYYDPYLSYYGNANNPYYNPTPDYQLTPTNYGPRGPRGGGISSGVVDSKGEGRANPVKIGRGDDYFETDTNEDTGRGRTISVGKGEATIDDDRTKTKGNTRDYEVEDTRSEEPAKNVRDTRKNTRDKYEVERDTRRKNRPSRSSSTKRDNSRNNDSYRSNRSSRSSRSSTSGSSRSSSNDNRSTRSGNKSTRSPR